MASPEYKFQPQVFYVPVDKISGPSTWLLECGQPQQHLPEEPDANPQNPLETSSLDSSLALENIQATEDQPTLPAIGLAAQFLRRGKKRIDLPINEIVAEYRNNVPVAELAERYSVNRSTIYNRLHESGLPEHRPTIIAKDVAIVERQFCWWRDLSVNAQKLYEILLGEGGDRDVLPQIAASEGWNLAEAIVELRTFCVIDERSPTIIKLVKGAFD